MEIKKIKNIMTSKKLHWYKYIVKRYLNDIQTSIRQSKNEMERSFYRNRYACQLKDFAVALGVHPMHLDKFIQKK